MSDRRFFDKDFNRGNDDYGVRGEKIVIGMDDIRDVFKRVIKRELVDKIEDELKRQLNRKL